MRRLFTAALAVALLASAPLPSFAEGEDPVAAPVGSPTWPQTEGRTPLASIGPKGSAILA